MCSPFMDAAGNVLEHSAKCIWKPFEKICDAFGKLPNAGLYFCGFSAILIPLIIAFFTFFLGFLLSEVIILASLGFLIGLIFLLIGIWPSLIIALDITGITIIRLPLNMYYHFLVTYRTVMLRRNIKIISFILLPIVHLLIPPITLILALIILVPWFAATAFAGFPLKNWEKIQPFHAKAWKKFATEIVGFSQNYGHPSGIPDNWDGTVYGLSVDPIVVILSIFLYIFSVIPLSLGVGIIFIIKAIPIFLGTVNEFSKSINLCKAVSWYLRVLRGGQTESPSSGRSGDRADSGHTAWISGVKRTTKGLKKCVEGYADIEICEGFKDIIKDYAKLVKGLNPAKLCKLTSSYMTDMSPCKIVPDDVGCSILILWLPILMTFIMWIIGLIFVLTIPPATFLLAFLVWILCWSLVISLPPVFYIAGWIFIIFGIPILYVLLWCFILVGPWIFSILGSVSGPLLAFKIPFTMMTTTYYNPVEMWSNMRRSLIQIAKVLRSVDKMTGKLSICNIRLIPGGSETVESVREERGQINYWSLYISRCIKESRRIQSLGWLSHDDILAVSSTATIAIPGVTIIAILLDSIKRIKNEKKVLIYWNEENKCKDSNRDFNDNVANLFMPQLMRVKEALLSVKGDLDDQTNWISASLCDGEDEKSEELRKVVENLNMKEAEHKNCLKIRATVENIVHSLLRVNALSSRLSEIFFAEDQEESF